MARNEKNYLDINKKPINSSSIGRMYVNQEINENDRFTINDTEKSIVDIYWDDDTVREIIDSNRDAKKRIENLLNPGTSLFGRFMGGKGKPDQTFMLLRKKEEEVRKLVEEKTKLENTLNNLKRHHKELFEAIRKTSENYHQFLSIFEEEMRQTKGLASGANSSCSSLFARVKPMADEVGFQVTHFLILDDNNNPQRPDQSMFKESAAIEAYLQTIREEKAELVSKQSALDAREKALNEKQAELDLVEKYSLPDTELLIVGHHGSRTSTDNLFLETIRAEDAVISVGSNNSYGHPNWEVLARLQLHGCNIWRTDRNGTVEIRVKHA